MTEVVLLDETDTKIRSRQHASIFAGIALLALARGVVAGEGPWFWAGIAAIIGAIALFGYGATAFQDWTVDYRGHAIRYRNNPLRGEKLFLDGAPAATGKLGYRTEMRATIRGGDAAGDVIVAESEAGLTRFRCRIVVRPVTPAAGAGAAAALSNEQLLEEIRRRGIERP
jgi:hypothetical protein